MLLLLNEKSGMNGGSGECDGMSVDSEAWELMLTLTNPRRTWSLAMSVRTVLTGIGDTVCDDTDILRKAWASTMKLFR
jgi:hypothetical protein